MVLFCFSLSLSLSLSHSLCMAPMCKTTPSWNLLHFKASSSNHTLHVWFCDEKARQDFSENFSKCRIHSKRCMILLDFFETTLPTIIHSWGLESLCEIPVSCPTMIIHEFYSNMHRINSSIPQFVTQVRGTCIVVTQELISNVLHIPRVSHPDYLGCPRLRTVSKDELLSFFYETPSS